MLNLESTVSRKGSIRVVKYDDGDIKNENMSRQVYCII